MEVYNSNNKVNDDIFPDKSPDESSIFNHPLFGGVVINLLSSGLLFIFLKVTDIVDEPWQYAFLLIVLILIVSVVYYIYRHDLTIKLFNAYKIKLKSWMEFVKLALPYVGLVLVFICWLIIGFYTFRTINEYNSNVKEYLNELNEHSDKANEGSIQQNRKLAILLDNSGSIVGVDDESPNKTEGDREQLRASILKFVEGIVTQAFINLESLQVITIFVVDSTSRHFILEKTETASTFNAMQSKLSLRAQQSRLDLVLRDLEAYIGNRPSDWAAILLTDGEVVPDSYNRSKDFFKLLAQLTETGVIFFAPYYEEWDDNKGKRTELEKRLGEALFPVKDFKDIALLQKFRSFTSRLTGTNNIPTLKSILADLKKTFPFIDSDKNIFLIIAMLMSQIGIIKCLSSILDNRNRCNWPDLISRIPAKSHGMNNLNNGILRVKDPPHNNVNIEHEPSKKEIRIKVYRSNPPIFIQYQCFDKFKKDSARTILNEGEVSIAEANTVCLRFEKRHFIMGLLGERGEFVFREVI